MEMMVLSVFSMLCMLILGIKGKKLNFLFLNLMFFFMLMTSSPMTALLFLVFGLLSFLSWMNFFKGVLLLLLYLGGMFVLFVYVMSFSKKMNFSFFLSFFLILFLFNFLEFDFSEIIFLKMYFNFFFVFVFFFLLFLLLIFLSLILIYSKSLRIM